MSLINLLPHRAAAKKMRRTLFKRHLRYCALMGLLLALALHLYFHEKLSRQQKVNQTLAAQSAELDKKIKATQLLQQAIQALLVRQQAVEAVQSERNISVYLLTALVKQLPEGVYLTSLRMAQEKVTLQGFAPSNEKVADFLQNIGTDTTWFIQPELLEVLAGAAHLSPKASRKVSEFSMRIHLKRSTPSTPARPFPP